MAKTEMFRIPRMTYGLMTQPAPTALPPGAFEQAQNFRLDAGRCGTAVGHTRWTNVSPSDNTYKLNGNDQFFRGRCFAAGNYTSLQSASFTLEFVFRCDTNRAYQVLMYKGTYFNNAFATWVGGAVATDFSFVQTDWAIYLRPDPATGNQRLYFWWGDGSIPTRDSIPFGAPTTIVPGTYYHAVVTRDATGPTYTAYVHPVASVLGAGTTSGAFTGLPQNFGGDFYVGAVPNAQGVRDADLVLGQFQGIIQEIRYWNVVRTTPQLEGAATRQLTAAEIASANLLMYHPMLGLARDTDTEIVDRYFFKDVKNSANSGLANAGVTLELKPTRASWIDANSVSFGGGPIAGSGAVGFDGRDTGLDVRDSYLYLTPQIDQNGALTHRANYTFSCRARALHLRNFATIWHWSHVAAETFTQNFPVNASPVAGGTTTINPATRFSIMWLGIRDTGGANYQFSGSIWAKDPAGVTRQYNVASNVGGGGLVAGTNYAISLIYDQTANTFSIKVDALAAVTVALTAGDKLLVTPDTPDGSARKYWMTLGRGFTQTRFSNTNTADPNAVDVEYSYSVSTFDGVLDQVVICGEAVAATGAHIAPTLGLHEYLANNVITRENVFSMQAVVLSAWLFNETTGGSISDIGVVANSITFREDPGHTHGKSGIITNRRRPFRYIGDHIYRTATGGQRLFVGIAGGTVWDITGGGVGVASICDGFRNDDDNLISAARFLDGLILCCGGKGGNYHLFERQLFSASLEPPDGLIPFGLTDQINPKAKLRKGVYKYLFTYYSAITGKRSPIGPQVVLEIKTERANVDFGSTAEINQTYPTTGVSDQKEEFDMTRAAGADTRFRCAGWYGVDYAGGAGIAVGTAVGNQSWWEEHPTQGPTVGPPNRRAKLCKPYFEKASGINAFVKTSDIDQVRADTMVNVIDEVSRSRVFLEANDDGTVTLKSCIAGGVYDDGAGVFYGARLFVGDIAGGPANMTQNAGKIDWDVAAPGAAPNGTTFNGTGTKVHTLKLPYSTNPQTTHLEIWRTLANDDTYRLAVRLPNGTTFWKDETDDEDLTGEVLDTTISTPPACRYVAELGGRMLFLSPTDNPQRAFFSDVGAPWSVPATNVVDFLDGSTLGLTGAAPVNGLLAVFKADTTFILRPPSNEFVPFDIQPRFHDIGCLSHFGVVQMNGGLVFPGERGFYAFDGNSMQYLSRVIQPTWAAFPSTYKSRIVGLWDRQGEACAWGVASTLTKKSPTDSTGVPDMCAYWCTTSPALGEDPTGWMPLTNLQMSATGTIQDSLGTRRVFFADEYGYTYEWNPAVFASNFGVGTLTPRGVTVSGAVSTTSFDVPMVSNYATLPEGYRGFWVTWQNAAGTIRETRQVYSDSLGNPTTRIVVDHAFSAAPQVGDTIIFGSIETSGILGQLSPFGPEGIHEWKELYVRADKQATAATFELGWQGLGGVNSSYREQEPPFTTVHTEDTISLSNQRVDMMHSLGQHAARGARLTLRIRSLGADKPFRLRDMSWKIVGPTDREFVPVT